ncbi:MAG: sugar phosphate isomerase/epimerase, partial [Planctomycetota bacterium]
MPHRYSVIIGNLGNTKDRFCGGYKQVPDKPRLIRAAAAIPHVRGVELVGTWDVTPDNAAEMATVLDG